MKASKQAYDLIRRFEGCRLEAYLCPAGKLTIGYGHTKNVKAGQHITKQQADDLLAQDVALLADSLSKLIKEKLTQNQFDALISLAFNIGITAFEQSTLLKLLNQGRFIVAAHEFEKWKYADGKVLPGLIQRRKAEVALFIKVK